MASAPKPVAKKKGEDGKDLHMFVWRSSASPVSDVFGNGTEAYNDTGAGAKDARHAVASSPRKGKYFPSITIALAVHSRAPRTAT